MSAKILQSVLIPGVLWISTERIPDDRGSFTEVWRRDWLPQSVREMVQGNRSYSLAGSLRGLHFHLRQSDLWRCEHGRAFVALADLRQRSPIVEVGQLDDPSRLLYIPPGVAHGYLAVDGDATVLYQVDRYYDPSDEHGVRWDDPQLNIPWPTKAPRLSLRDERAPDLEQVLPAMRQAARDLLQR